MTPEHFLDWQLFHYSKRLLEAKKPKEIAFLREELTRLEKSIK